MSGALLLALAVLAGCGDEDQGGKGAGEGNGRIAFASSRDGDFDIYVMAPDGTGVTNLTKNEGSGADEADDQSPAWSPDGEHIAFTSTRGHQGDGIEDIDIYVMRADGSEQRRLTDEARLTLDPQWTPAGEVAFATCSESFADCRIDTMKMDGSDRKTLYELTDGVSPHLPSPDGETVLFAPYAFTEEGEIDRDVDIWAMKPDGTERRQLTSSSGMDGGPVWSPDGSQIAFLSERDRNGDCLWHDCVGFNPEIYVMAADGNRQRRLTEDEGEEAGLDWSPDGTRILFSAFRDGNDYELYVMNADGTCLTPLTKNGEWDWSPDWYWPKEGAAGPLDC